MKPAGLSATSREQLSRLLRDSPSVLTAGHAAIALGMTHAAAARRLAAWSRAGWLARVRRGAYVPVPIESASSDIALEDPWSVATAMFAPCYIGGWSAAEHWGLTEQIFRSICIMTTNRPRNRSPSMRKARFELHTIPAANFIGLKTVWRGGTRVQVSDPARTLVDMLDDPWALVERLVTAHPPVGSVVVTTANRSWAMHERAEQAGCRALLDKPFDPGHLYRVFQMV